MYRRKPKNRKGLWFFLAYVILSQKADKHREEVLNKKETLPNLS